MQLNDLLIKTFRIDDIQKKALTKLCLFTVRDLLFYFPARYASAGDAKQIGELAAGDTATVFGKVTKTGLRKAWKKRIPMGEATIEDASGKLKVLWFNQAYMSKMLTVGAIVKLSGKISGNTNGIYMANPELGGADTLIDEKNSLFAKSDDPSGNELLAIYPETKGISSTWIAHKIKKILAAETQKELEDYLPESIVEKYNLPSLTAAIVFIHTPKRQSDAIAARKRFAFEEVLFMQLARQKERAHFRKNKAFRVRAEDTETAAFIQRFPFAPTKAQYSAAETILSDLKKDVPMSRLLEGDVGSGKTLVAAIAAHAVVSGHPESNRFGNLQVAYMAPTEILAAQHFESFIKYFKHLGISVGLITGKTARKFPSKINPDSWTDISRTQLLKWVKGGDIPILFGTHALIQKSVQFKHLALVIIDEQHRFGTNQRATLARKEGFAPHFLSMTATPIPRTLALTAYGDLDLSLIDEMPAGRKRIITEIVTQEKRNDAYAKIRAEIKAGRQAYVICPRIDEPDPEKQSTILAKSVITEAKRLREDIFTSERIEILHSKMSKERKEKVMKEFVEGDIDILVATSVIEVGVNVPNATIIIIEGAERFGLAQLHQLRGRVVRSEHQAYCYIFSDAKTKKSLERLSALVKAKNGFELAELDLAQRGAGDLAGAKQWGISDIGMEALKNLKLVQAARKEAEVLISEDETLSLYPRLHQELAAKKKNIHFE
ncbi:MAG: ATP-dependent DNA helicase RecG [Candidatus Pacebacteria bacterium]|nr:ATP-dependent DNA helicase RecG [Candidatus Paceibacterota bacterium]